MVTNNSYMPPVIILTTPNNPSSTAKLYATAASVTIPKTKIFLQETFLELQHPPDIIRKQIKEARMIPWDYLLQNRSKQKQNTTGGHKELSAQTSSMCNYTPLSQVLGGKSFLTS